MKYPPRYFYDNLPEWKRKKDPPLARIFYRPLSFLGASICAQFGIHANAVSYFSTGVAILACVIFLIPSYVALVVAAVLVNVWIFLDCVDGNLARSVKAQAYGEYADATSSYLLVGFLLTAMGFATYHSGGLFFDADNATIILIGVIGSSSDSLMRLCYQKYLVVSTGEGKNLRVSQDLSNASKIDRIRIIIDQNIGIGGILPAAVLLGAIFGFLDVVVLVWSAYFFLSFLATYFYLMRKTISANRNQ